MADYVCKEAGCDESVAWHLIHGELDCIGDNREAISEYAEMAEARLHEPLGVTVVVTAPGYEDHNVIVGLTPLADVPPPPEPQMQDMEMG